MEKRRPNRASPRLAEKSKGAAQAASRGVSTEVVVGLCVALFSVVVLAFFPATRNGFINYDDDLYVTKNTHVQGGLTLSGLKWALVSTQASNWHPVTWISHMLDCQLFGLNAAGHHATNILLHALNTVLLFLLLREMTAATWRSLFVAALFGLHPVHVESVAWISERKDVLSTFFFLATLWAYSRYVECGMRSAECGARRSQAEHPTSNITHHALRITHHVSFFYLLALLCFALGLMSKPMLVTVPFVLLLLDLWPLRRFSLPSTGQNVSGVSWLMIEKIPFFLLSAAACVITSAVQKQEGAMVMLIQLPLSARVENALVSYSRYLGMVFWPVDLAVFYPHPEHWGTLSVVGSALVLLALCILAVWLRRSRPFLLVGWFWFVGALVPVIGLVQVGQQSIADRYTYIPYIGLFIALTWGLYELSRRWSSQKVTFTLAAVALVLVLISETRRQVNYWKSSETLFRHAIAVTRNNYVAFFHAADYAFFEKGEVGETIGLCEDALKARPLDVEAQNLLGLALTRQGHVEEGLVHFRQAIKLKPDFAKAHGNLGNALARLGRLEEAISQLQEAVRLKPDSMEGHYNLGIALCRNGRLDQGIVELQETLKFNPNSAETHCGLGVAFAAKGRREEAVDHLKQALALRPNFPEAQQTLLKLTGSDRMNGR
jgi:tetratricopeptide (TPR) repeat protein